MDIHPEEQGRIEAEIRRSIIEEVNMSDCPAAYWECFRCAVRQLECDETWLEKDDPIPNAEIDLDDDDLGYLEDAAEDYTEDDIEETWPPGWDDL